MQKFEILEIFDQLTHFNNSGAMVTNNKVKQTKIGGKFKSSIYNATFIFFTLRKKFLPNLNKTINKTIHPIATITLKNFVEFLQLRYL